MSHFIDRSMNNGADDYKTAPITHLYLKATEGTSITDSTYQERKAAGVAAGAVVGAYHYATEDPPIAEANHFLATIGVPKVGEFRPCLDLEDGEDAAWAVAFVTHVKNELGYWPVLYGNTSTIGPLRDANATLRLCPYWRAEYGPNDGDVHALEGGTQGAIAHQYTSEAVIPGIAAPSDASVFVGDASLMLVPQPMVREWTVTYHDRNGSKHKTITEHPAEWVRDHPAHKYHGRIIIDPIFSK